MQAAFGNSSDSVGPNDLGFEYNYAYTPAGKVSSKTLEVQSYNHLLTNGTYAYGALTASYTYDGQGALLSVVYPQCETWVTCGTQTSFTYTLDDMERPTAMTNENNHVWASGVTYNAANQPTYDGTAHRAYNNLLQITSISGAGMNMTYNYSSTQNNGQITSSHDAINGETITYQYDALKRLLSASATSWGETYGYDGYGNLTQMNPSGTGAPTLSVNVALDANNVPTNRIAAQGVMYDNNGNQTQGFGLAMTYDVANRLSAVGNGTFSYYAYDSDNRRIYSRNASGSETIYFYGADGMKIATYTYAMITYEGNAEIQLTQQSQNVYFLGKPISAEGNLVSTDRLGSVRSGGPGGLGYQAQYPYGVEYSLPTANDREKYATYTRDSATGFDYAVNRYYASQWGRFLSPDPYAGSSDPSNPQSWNLYPYVGGDPVNSSDPSGLFGIPPYGPGGPVWPGGGGEGFGTNPVRRELGVRFRGWVRLL
jgi:RHS repeat-associated protein